MQSTVAVRCLFGLALLLTVTAISSAQSVSFKEFPIPNANYLNFIAAGPDGAVWFTDTYGDKIGRVTTDGTITEFQMPITGSYPAGITGGPDGAVWFTESGGNRIGRITADGNIREFPIPPPFGQIWSITTGPDGALWFTDYTNRKIGRIKTDGAITEYQIPNPTTYPWDITSGPDGALWFADLHGNKIGRITTTGDITEFPLAPTNYSFGPQGITSGPDGALWFVGYDSQVGRITTTGNIIEFQLPTANVHAPWSIAQGPDGALWFSAANNIDRISTTGAITEFPIPTANPWATDIAATPDGALWFLELEARKIGRLTIASPVTITSVSLPIGVLGTPYSAPTLQASGGTTPYTWTATGLPPGMSINSAGMVSGTPTSLGTFNPTITATDSSIPTQTAQKVFPIQIVSSTASITVTTNPAGLQIVVDGNMVTSPRSFVWDVGSGHSIGVLSPQGSGGTRSVFTVWSDNGAQTHNVTTPATTATYTANFKTQNLLTTAVSPPGTGTVSANPPSADGFYDNSTTVVLTASGLFLNWSGDLSGSANPQPLAMTVPRLVTATFNAVSITEYPLPLFGSSPTGITEGPDGALWFAEGNGNKIGRITTVGTITEFPIPTAASGPNYIAAGPDGSLWFAEAGVGKIGRITTDGNITEFHISAAPYGIAAGPDGALWFVETGASKIGRITTTGDITESLIPTADSFPLDIAKGPDGALWFTENRGNKIGRISVTGDITEFLIPSSGSSPQGITAGSDGALWFIENRGNKIGRVATDGTINEFLIPTAGSFPLEIAAGPDGALWFTENGGNKIGRITTAGTITEFPVPTFGSYLWGITAGTDGAMWFTEGNGNQIGRIAIASPVAITTVSLPYGVFNTPYSTTTLQAAGGSPPYTWAATDLPSGLTLSTSGVLSGTPISIGIFSPTIVATDISVTPQVAQSILNVTVVPRLSITSGCPGSPFTIGTLFSYSLAAAGGTGTYLWSISTGSLPGGLGIDGSTIGGIVTAPTGTFNFTIQASSGSQSASLSCSLTVLNPTTGISVVTSPAGLQMIVDGITMTSPQNFIWVVGSSHTIGVPSLPQGSGGTRSVFTGWSDNGSLSHSVATPATTTTYTANFKTQNYFTIAVSPPGTGTVTANPISPDGFYDAGTPVQLTATGATVGSTTYNFASWSGDLTGSVNPQSAVMSAARSVTANFGPRTSAITVNSNPAGLQIIVDDVTVTAPQIFNWIVGSTHSIGVASPQGTGGTRSVFTSWSDEGPQTHNIVTPPAATTYTVDFKKQYLLTSAVDPVGSGTVTVTSASSDGFYDSGTTVQLTATGTGSFLNWGGDLSGTTNPISLVMSAPRSVTAVFGGTATNSVTVTTSPAGLQLTVDGNIVIAPQTFNWIVGSNHTIGTTSPQGTGGTRSAFTGWSDGGSQIHTITAPGTTTIFTAAFVTQYLLTTVVSPAGTGTVTASPTSADGYYNSGTSVLLTASGPNSFQNWSGALSGSVSPQSIVMNAPRSVTASFIANNVITVTTNPAGMPISVDGISGTAPQTFNWIVGSSHTIAVASTQGSGGTRSAFATWSDGGAQSHSITIPVAPTTYTATFKTQYLLSTGVSPSNTGTVTASPSSADGFYDSGANVQFTAAGLFQNWSGSLSGSANPQSLVINGPRTVTANFAGATPPPLTYVLPTNLDPTQQQPVQLNLTSAYPLEIAGQLTIAFAPNTLNNADDPMVMFTTGSRTVDFKIPANSLTAQFYLSDVPKSDVKLQAGTVAGTISITANVKVTGVNLTPTPDPIPQLEVSQLAPSLMNDMRLVATSTGMDVEITAYSTTRDVRKAIFQFTPAGGGNLKTQELTLDVSNAFTTWYQSPDSQARGSSFQFVQSFVVQGDIKDIDSVSITLVNSKGNSVTRSAKF